MAEFKPGKNHDSGLAQVYVGLVKKAKTGVGGQEGWDLFTEHIRKGLIAAEITAVLNAQDSMLSAERFRAVFVGLYDILTDHWGEGFK
jgi:hypothetical protein